MAAELDKKAEKATNMWIQLPSATQSDISQRIESLLNKRYSHSAYRINLEEMELIIRGAVDRLANVRVYKSFNAPMLPIVHGTLIPPKDGYDDYSLSARSPHGNSKSGDMERTSS